MRSPLPAPGGSTAVNGQMYGPARPAERRRCEHGSLECPVAVTPRAPAAAKVAVRGVEARTRTRRRRFEPGELDSLVGGRFQLGCLLGRGGMASVYAARDLSLGRSVALKILSPDYGENPLVIARFQREAEITAKLHHPNIVEVFDFGSMDHREEHLIYLAMELLEGESLRRTLEREATLPWPRVRALMLDICAGLGAAHAAGVIHRDLKPSNCFRVGKIADESVQLVDFGIAKLVGDHSHRRLTLADHIVGTPEYMSPEQACGEPLDQRSDIYAAALILGELLTGRLPFEATTPAAMLAAHAYEAPPALGSLTPEGVEFPAELEAIYARALNKDPAKRHPDIASFAAALRSVEAPRPRRVFEFFRRAFTPRR